MIKKGEIVFCSFLALLAIAALIISLTSYEIYSKTGLAAGFAPVCASIILTAASIGQVIQLVRRKKLEKKENKFESHSDIKKVLVFLAMLLVYIVFIDILGMFLSSYIFMILMFWRFENKSLLNSFIVSTCMIVVLYLLFVVCFNIPMPKGILKLPI